MLGRIKVRQERLAEAEPRREMREKLFSAQNVDDPDEDDE